MRIAFVLISQGYGGLERHVIDLANALAQDDAIEVAVFTDPSFREKLQPKVRLYPIKSQTWRFNPWALWQLKTQLRALAPDVIHAQANKAAAMVHLSTARAPAMIATLHNLKNNTRVFSPYDGVIAVSKAVAQRLSHPNIAVIENGINPPTRGAPEEIAALRATFCAPDEPLTLAVGRLVAAKGFDVLLSAWRDLPGKLVIVGSGEDEAALKAQQQALGLTERVVFAGFRRDVANLMAAADLMVMSSRREGFAYVLVEALHVGVPIVATEIPGAREFLPAHAVVARDDADALHAALARALTQPAQLKAAYAPYFAHARNELTLRQMAEKTHAFYAATLQQNENHANRGSANNSA
jgi:glycosyltransferase involved in cell wall biosynthesis